MRAKKFKTIDEQVEILRTKGLVISDEQLAKDILIRENYFFLSGYRHLFLKEPGSRYYIPNTNFSELYGMFTFDRHVRNIIFKNLLIVENNIKSIFSYQLSKKYGFKEKDYLKPTNFNTDPERTKQVNDLIRKMKRQIKVNGKQHTATTHYITNYGYIPMWIVVKVLSFGIVTELFNIMKPEDQNEIANIYKIDVCNLMVYWPILANFRNLCAHEDILYDHRTQRLIDDTKYHRIMDIPIIDGEFIYGKNDLFAVLIILKQMLRPDEFTLMMNEISYEVDILEGKLKVITVDKVLDRIGFPKNFKKLARID